MLRPLILPALALALAACATTPDHRAPAPPASVRTEPSGSTPVARFSGRVVSLAEVDARAGDELSKLQEQVWQARTDAAERIALQAIVSAEARKEGVTEERWLSARIEDALAQPTEAQMEELFEQARGKVPAGTTYEDAKPALRDALLREARARRAHEVFEELKAQAKYEVVLEEPARPRKAVESIGPARGPADAKVTIVVFSDFQCPYCARAAQTVEQVLAAYPATVRLVYRHYPLSFHAQAPKAAEASMCAFEQGRFWEFHDVLYANQRALEPGDLKAHAARVGLDAKRFGECLDSGRKQGVVQRDLEAGEQLGVSGTPAYFINGLLLSGARPVEDFKRVIDKELARLEVAPR